MTSNYCIGISQRRRWVKKGNMSGKYAFITLRTDGCNHKNRSMSLPCHEGMEFHIVFPWFSCFRCGPPPPPGRRSPQMYWTWPWCRGSPGHRSWMPLRRWPTLQADIFLRRCKGMGFHFNLEDDGRWYELPCKLHFFETQIDSKIWAVATLFSVHVS